VEAATFAALIALLAAAGPIQGVGPYHFGMTPDQVRAVEACTPYKPVIRTGGLECPDYEFEGARMNVSFLFGEQGLRRIQLWFYEGTDRAQAVAAAERALRHLETGYGRLRSSAPDEAVTAESLIGAAEAPIGDRPGRVDVFPAEMPPERQVYGAVGYVTAVRSYLVFLFYSLPPTR
jgi:hypothetical protein